MTPPNTDTADLLARYLAGTLTAPEEAELERRAQRDPTLGEALAALYDLPEHDHQASVNRMMTGAATTISTRNKTDDLGDGAQVPPPFGGWGDTRAMVGTKPKTSQKTKPRPIKRWTRRLAAAAAVLLIISALFILPRLADQSYSTAAEYQPESSATPDEVPALNGALPPDESTMTDDAAGAEDLSTPESKVRPEDTSNPESTTPPTNSHEFPSPPTPRAPREEVSRPATTDPEVRVPPLIDEAASEEVESTSAPVHHDHGAPRTSDDRVADDEDLPEPGIAPLPSSTTTAPTLSAPQPETRSNPASSDKTLSRRTQAPYPTRYRRTQPFTLTGVVTDTDGRPLPGATVALPGLPLGETTDSNGVFTLPPGSHITAIVVSAEGYYTETIDVPTDGADLQIALETTRPPTDFDRLGSVTTIDFDDDNPGYAQPAEGYRALRRRIKANAPPELPAGKYRFSFLVEPDGKLYGFEFHGRTPQAVRDYLEAAIRATPGWEVRLREEGIRVSMRIRLGR